MAFDPQSVGHHSQVGYLTIVAGVNKYSNIGRRTGLVVTRQVRIQSVVQYYHTLTPQIVTRLKSNQLTQRSSKPEGSYWQDHPGY
jgi:hypothetical protein